MIKGGDGKRDMGSGNVEGKMEGWNNGRCEEGVSFIFYLLIAWRAAAVTELRFKTISVHLRTFPNDAFVIHQHQPFTG